MYICVCKAVSDKRVRQCVREGAATLKDLRDRTALGTGCGKCVPSAYALLRESLAAEHSPSAAHEIATIARTA